MRSSAKADAPILITMGEPAGVGPDVALAAFDHFGGKIGKRPLKLVGDPSVFGRDDVIATSARATRTPRTPDTPSRHPLPAPLAIAVSDTLH